MPSSNAIDVGYDGEDAASRVRQQRQEEQEIKRRQHEAMLEKARLDAYQERFKLQREHSDPNLSRSFDKRPKDDGVIRVAFQRQQSKSAEAPAQVGRRKWDPPSELKLPLISSGGPCICLF
jgi:type II secretory pathway component PulJ